MEKYKDDKVAMMCRDKGFRSHGDGKLWVVELSLRKSDGKEVLFAYDPVKGTRHKSFSMEIAGTMPVACDMNADGKDELIFIV